MVTSHSWKILEKGVKLQQPNSQQILKGWSNLVKMILKMKDFVECRLGDESIKSTKARWNVGYISSKDAEKLQPVSHFKPFKFLYSTKRYC